MRQGEECSLPLRGVLSHQAAQDPGSEVEADPAWEDVQMPLVPRSTAPRNKFVSICPSAKPGLWLYAAEQGTDLECGLSDFMAARDALCSRVLDDEFQVS